MLDFVNFSQGLAPSSNLEKAQSDMLCDGCSDVSNKFLRARYETDEKRKVSNTIIILP